MRYSLLFLLFTILMCSGKDKAEEALDAARSFAEEGKFDKALERHLWFHDKALKICPSYYGVRLSFALSDWLELGEKYPPALEALKDVRRAKTTKIIEGANDFELFHDVQSINETLGEIASTVLLFKELDNTRPEFAAEVYRLVADDLVTAKEYKLARKYLTDPMKKFARKKEGLQEVLEWAEKGGEEESLIKALESNFEQDVIVLITILVETGEEDLARRMKGEALKLVDSPRLEAVLKK